MHTCALSFFVRPRNCEFNNKNSFNNTWDNIAKILNEPHIIVQVYAKSFLLNAFEGSKIAVHINLIMK